MNYILFDPPGIWENLLPLTFTRPVSGIRVGILTIREKWEKYLGVRPGCLTKDHLQEELTYAREEDTVFINGSVLPDNVLVSAIKKLGTGQVIATEKLNIASRLPGKKAAGFDPAAIPVPSLSPDREPRNISYPWEIFTMNGEEIMSDFRLLTKGRESRKIPSSNSCREPGNIFLESGAKAENAVFNAGAGPIYIGKNAEIMEGALVRGPFAIGEGSVLKMGAKIYGPTTIGPLCKAGGEINNSVIFGYSNKAHDGFLGQSVIGEWCNIGADSNNSNLKNNYTRVRLWNYREERFVDTGLLFCGLIMGDHSKCGINTMFNTGTVVGVSANIFGEGFPRNFIPSFSWGGQHGFTTYRSDKALETAAVVMKRRGKEISEADIRILETVFRLTEKYRS